MLQYKADNLDALLIKADEIPVSLALAQAVIESGWGTSRFAYEGNALFGQYVWGNSDTGSYPMKEKLTQNIKLNLFKA